MGDAAWKEPKEIEIPIPYGHIAAKVWGNEDGEPVLALHGRQDNAGEFDKLVPLLTPDLYIVALDAVGHGLSSHRPAGTFYSYMEMVLDIRRVVKYLKWDAFSLVGFCMGGSLAVLYGGVFPEAVKNIVLLEVVKAPSESTEHLPVATRNAIEFLLDAENKLSRTTAPVYTVEEARARMLSSLRDIVDGVTEETADYYMKRGTVPSSDGKGVVFARDIRVKFMTEELQKLSHDDLKAFARRVKCNMLIVLATESNVYKCPRQRLFRDFLDIYKENCQSFEVVKVEGNHFVHLNNPEDVAPHINAFFEKHSSLTAS